ncbi:MAG: DUF393 domain-containing protein [Gammaproteobacteria bacterium]
MKNQVTMFYDGGCQLCSREVLHYRRLDHEQAVNWVNISADVKQLESLNLTREEAMARLHVIDSSGKLQTGAAAFAALWSALPYYRWLAACVRTLHLVPLLDLIYEPFARWRLARRTDSCPV